MKTNRLIAAIAIALVSLAAHAQEGAWSGTLDIMGTKLPLVFNFSVNGCTVDSPSQGAKGIPAEKYVNDDGTVKVSIDKIGACFEGKKDGTTIKGTFTQNGFAVPLTLKPGVPVCNRPQTPVPPFPYKEENVNFTNAGYTFGGTLTLPANYTRQTMAVLLVTGSGQQNRDEEMFNHKPFAVIADALARNGIASLRYDDRGWGDNGVNFSDFTTDDFKQDAEAGLTFLRSRFSKVGIIGHSKGGTIALMLAAEGKADFIVSLAGMAMSGKETLVMQNRQAMSGLGLPKDVVDNYCSVISRVLDEISQGKKIDQINTDGIPEQFKPVLEQVLEQGNTPYIRHFIHVNAAPVLSKIKCPVLALNGTKDCQVDCTENMSALEKGLTGCKATIKKMDGVNHLFQHCQTGSIVEYQQIEETIAPEVLQTVTEWIKSMI